MNESELDKRTNESALTDEGRQAVLNRVGWVLSKYVTDDSRASEVSDLIDE